MRVATTIIGFAAAMTLMFAVMSFIPAQRRAFGDHQGLVLLVGETGSFMCLAYILEVKKKGKEWVIASLVWLSFAPVLLAAAYVQLPSRRAARYEERVQEAASRAHAYRSRHSGKPCPPLEAEHSARMRELEAWRIRAGGSVAYRGSFDSGLAFAGAVGAATMAAMNSLTRRRA